MAFTFFGIQVAVRTFFKAPAPGAPADAPGGDDLRRRLHEAIAGSEAEQSLDEKRRFWKRLCAILNEAMPVFEYGYWDLIRGAEAEKEFESWSAEIEGSLATEAEEMGAAADEVNRLSADRRYLLVTLAFLAEQGSNSDLTLGERCDLPESAWFTRQTFAHLVATIPMLNFANLQADAVYLVPGNDSDGLSDDDLHAEGYRYLKPLA